MQSLPGGNSVAVNEVTRRHAMEHLITLEEVCAILRVSVGTGRNRLSRGQPMPPSFRTGRRRLFVASLVDEWIHHQATARLEPGASTPPPTVPRRGRPRADNRKLA
jgi:predicted DNA-binding transcriptional regulator AlpA